MVERWRTLDGIHDMGGMHGWGDLAPPLPEPVFAEHWEGRAFALSLLSMRLSGRNLDAFRHALERLQPIDYLVDGYYGRWLHAAELLLTDSNIIAKDAVDARIRANAGEKIEEPPVPEPTKPDYQPTGPGSLRSIDDPPKFSVGERVMTKDLQTAGHTKLARYLRRRPCLIQSIRPAALLPDTHAHFLGENAQHVYAVTFDSQELWGAEAEKFELTADLYESYLEAVA
ncbi:nitrile hydratase subunit beta [Streptomyces sp. NPDC055722]